MTIRQQLHHLHPLYDSSPFMIHQYQNKNISLPYSQLVFIANSVELVRTMVEFKLNYPMYEKPTTHTSLPRHTHTHRKKRGCTFGSYCTKKKEYLVLYGQRNTHIHLKTGLTVYAINVYAVERTMYNVHCTCTMVLLLCSIVLLCTMMVFYYVLRSSTMVSYYYYVLRSSTMYVHFRRSSTIDQAILNY